MEQPEPDQSDLQRGQPPARHASHGAHGPWFSPWSVQKPWWILLAGVVLGRWLGYSPHLFVVTAAVCLMVGFLNEAGGSS